MCGSQHRNKAYVDKHIWAGRVGPHTPLDIIPHKIDGVLMERTVLCNSMLWKWPIQNPRSDWLKTEIKLNELHIVEAWCSGIQLVYFPLCLAPNQHFLAIKCRSFGFVSSLKPRIEIWGTWSYLKTIVVYSIHINRYILIHTYIYFTYIT